MRGEEGEGEEQVMQIWPKQRGAEQAQAGTPGTREQGSPTKNVSLTLGQLLQGPSEDAWFLYLL